MTFERGKMPINARELEEVEPVVPRNEAEREARYCRRAWDDGHGQGRREGLIVGFAAGFGSGIILWLVALVGLAR